MNRPASRRSIRVRDAAWALLVIAGATLAPAAQALSETAPAAVLAHAVASARRGADDPANRFAFTQEWRSDTLAVTARFDPRAPEAERWTLLAPPPEEAGERHADILKALREDVDADLELMLKDVEDYAGDCRPAVVEDASFWRFECAAPSSDEEIQAFRDALVGIIELDRNTGEVARYTLTSIRPFKPVPIAKVTSLKVRMTMAPAWDTGPRIIATVEESVSGAALFRTFEQSSVSVVRDVERVGPLAR